MFARTQQEVLAEQVADKAFNQAADMLISATAELTRALRAGCDTLDSKKAESLAMSHFDGTWRQVELIWSRTFYPRFVPAEEAKIAAFVDQAQRLVDAMRANQNKAVSAILCTYKRWQQRTP